MNRVSVNESTIDVHPQKKASQAPAVSVDGFQERKRIRSCGSSRRRRGPCSDDSSTSTASALSRRNNHHHSPRWDGSVSSARSKASGLAVLLNKAPAGSCIPWFAFPHCRDHSQQEAKSETTCNNQDINLSPGGGNDDHHHHPTVLDQSSMIGSTRNNGTVALDSTKVVVMFTMKEIKRATGNFSTSKIVGEGKFGIVYRGVLNDGTEVAVKCAKKDIVFSSSSSSSMHVPPPADFENEILTLSRVDHFNLVRYYGCLQKDGEQPIIVSEYVGNGNLRQNLTGPSAGERLGMGERVQIAIDVAAAVTYLHTYAGQKIIHRDVKASNVLLTKNNRAKVADFGFARLIDDDLQKTYITTGIKGTEGYLDPEYHKTYRLTERSDVYSFGVLLVELVTGLPPIVIDMKKNKRRNNTEWAMKNYRAGNWHLVMDDRLGEPKTMMMGIASNLLGLAEMCIAPTREARPSMKECGEVLWKIRTELQKLQHVMSRSSSYGFESQSLEEPDSSVSRVSSYSATRGMERQARDVHVLEESRSEVNADQTTPSTDERQTKRHGPKKKESPRRTRCHIL